MSVSEKMTGAWRRQELRDLEECYFIKAVEILLTQRATAILAQSGEAVQLVMDAQVVAQGMAQVIQKLRMGLGPTEETK